MKYALILALALVACSQPARSVDWFEKHPGDAATVSDQCLLQHRTSEECRNAIDATRENDRKRLELFRKSS